MLSACAIGLAEEALARLMMLNQSRICKGCWEQLHVPVPLRGVLSLPFRAFGIRQSRMNPNTCTICELMFTKVMRARKITIDATIMFADLRDYTSLSQSLSPDVISALLDTFYDECASAIWEYDVAGLIAIKRTATRKHSRHGILALFAPDASRQERKLRLLCWRALTASPNERKLTPCAA